MLDLSTLFRYGGLTCSGPSNEMFMVDTEQFVWRAPLQHVRARASDDADVAGVIMCACVLSCVRARFNI